MSSPRGLPTLRARLVRHVIVPLALTWLLGTLGMVAVSNLFLQRALDRSLLDDALLLTNHVKRQSGQLMLDLSTRELSHVLHDPNESVYFAVLRQNGTLVAGHAGLHPSAQPAAGQPPVFAAAAYQGLELRSVALRRELDGEPFDVLLAQTHRWRDELLQQLLLLSIAPQALLLLLLAGWLWRVIRRDLQPLAQLERAVDERPAHDLTPLPAPAATSGSALGDDGTRDVAQLRGALNELLGRIAASVQAQREFAGNVAHELRTPLAGIRVLADYGLAHPDPAVWRAQLQAIQGSEARASHLVDQLLALALADEAGTALPLHPTDLVAEVRAAVLRWLPRADAAGVDLGAEFEACITVPAHPTLIEGVLGNLIDNALRHGCAGASAPTVTVSLRADAAAPGAARRVHLAVVDNGPGIPPELAQQWAGRWQRGKAAPLGAAADPTPSARGSGLGLAIVGAYARLMGASLSLLPAVGGGLCAQVEWVLPPGT